jgi:hypothetical protein
MFVFSCTTKQGNYPAGSMTCSELVKRLKIASGDLVTFRFKQQMLLHSSSMEPCRNGGSM